jgi:hypothetical protein
LTTLMADPVGAMEVNDLGDVYVTDSGNNRVQK